MQIIIRIDSIEPLDNGSGRIVVNAQVVVQELDEKTQEVLSEMSIPGAFKSIVISGDTVIKALDGIDPAKDRDLAEAALFQTALAITASDPDFNPAIIEARLAANAKSQAVVDAIHAIMGTDPIDVPILSK